MDDVAVELRKIRKIFLLFLLVTVINVAVSSFYTYWSVQFYERKYPQSVELFQGELRDLLEKKNYDEVLRITAITKEKNQKDSPAYFYSGLAHFGKGEYQEALQDFETAGKLRPELMEQYIEPNIQMVKDAVTKKNANK